MRKGLPSDTTAAPAPERPPGPPAEAIGAGAEEEHRPGSARLDHPSTLGEQRRPRRGRWVFVGAVMLVIAGASALFTFGLYRDPTAIRSPLVGRPAPDFALPLLDGGGTIRLSDLRGQVVVLNFWASWCVACREEHPNFVLAWDRYRDQGVVVLGIVYQDSPSSAMSYMEKMGGDWPNAVDPESSAALAYGVYGVPETFFIDARGVVRHKQIGATSYDFLVREVQRLLSSRDGP